MFSVRSLETFLSDYRVRERQKGKSLVIDSATGLSRYVEVQVDGSFVCTFSLQGTKWVSFHIYAWCKVYGSPESKELVAETSEQLQEFLLATLPFTPAVRSNTRMMKRLVQVVDRHAWVVFQHSDAVFAEDETMGISCSSR